MSVNECVVNSHRPVEELNPDERENLAGSLLTAAKTASRLDLETPEEMERCNRYLDLIERLLIEEDDSVNGKRTAILAATAVLDLNVLFRPTIENTPAGSEVVSRLSKMHYDVIDWLVSNIDVRDFPGIVEAMQLQQIKIRALRSALGGAPYPNYGFAEEILGFMRTVYFGQEWERIETWRGDWSN